jgi:DNA-binding NarL/FixJ family response regulator
MEAPRVVVVADDLIWSSRLRAAAERAGAEVVRERGDVVIVDLTGRAYDGVEAVAAAAQTGATVIAVGQHEDAGLRKRALAAGARRVYSYNKLFSDGPAVIGQWLKTGQ